MKHGFVLFELLIVIGILIILIAAVFTFFQIEYTHSSNKHTPKSYKTTHSVPKEFESMQYDGHTLIHDPACKCNQR